MIELELDLIELKWMILVKQRRKKNSVKLGNRSDRYGANVAISSLDPPRFFYFFKKKKLIANGVSRRSFVFFVMEGFVSNLT